MAINYYTQIYQEVKFPNCKPFVIVHNEDMQQSASNRLKVIAIFVVLAGLFVSGSFFVYRFLGPKTRSALISDEFQDDQQVNEEEIVQIKDCLLAVINSCVPRISISVKNGAINKIRVSSESKNLTNADIRPYILGGTKEMQEELLVFDLQDSTLQVDRYIKLGLQENINPFVGVKVQDVIRQNATEVANFIPTGETTPIESKKVKQIPPNLIFGPIRRYLSQYEVLKTSPEAIPEGDLSSPANQKLFDEIEGMPLTPLNQSILHYFSLASSQEHYGIFSKQYMEALNISDGEYQVSSGTVPTDNNFVVLCYGQKAARCVFRGGAATCEERPEYLAACQDNSLAPIISD